MKTWMGIARYLRQQTTQRQDLLCFVMIGGLQFVLDALLLLAMAQAGANLAIANIASRALAACCGYYLNGKFSFAGQQHPTLTGQSLRRFWILWLSLTLLSSALISGAHYLTSSLSGHTNIILLSEKLVIEALLFMLSFALCKYWVYR